MTKRERQVTDREEILKILDKCKILHLGLVDGDEPYVVPMNYGYVMEGEQLTLYMHGATKGYKLDLMRKNPKVFFEMECDVQGFEGEIACQYGTVYQSIMGRGRAEIVEDVERKKEMLTLFMKSQTGRDFTFTDIMVSAVTLVKIDVSEYTAKRRPMPGTYV
ncbi:MAG: pyridoxamine 5'-phosphate oxidase family protein [Firmicutes bacterium]|nr:pyridoxamine 5'-phosphate oxidase family protein [Bacillota bacterium]MBR7148804.1 pyridoxamine 5'-phosphate oxidase family protein [Bacillota bacterium]